MEGIDFLGAVGRQRGAPLAKKLPHRRAGKASSSNASEPGSIDAPLAPEVKVQVDAKYAGSTAKRARPAPDALFTSSTKPREMTLAKLPSSNTTTQPAPSPAPAPSSPASLDTAPASSDASGDVGSTIDHTPMPEGEEEIDYEQFQADEAANYVPPDGPNDYAPEEDFYSLIDDELSEEDESTPEDELEAEDESSRVDLMGAGDGGGFDWMSLASGFTGGLTSFGGGGKKPAADDGKKLEALLAKQKADEELRRAQEQASTLKTYLAIAVSGAIGAVLYFTQGKKR